jgi:NAD(P)H-dependent flavin oxidoreductase YrpB (nitropropane dioxygenase family)
LCDLVGVEVPIIQAGMSIFTSPALAAAVSEAGALGGLGAWNRPTDQLQRELAELRDLTERPIAVNHVVPDLNTDAFAATLERVPAVVSFALDDAGADLIERSTMPAASSCNRSRPSVRRSSPSNTALTSSSPKAVKPAATAAP